MFKEVTIPDRATKGAVIRNIVIGAVCLAMLILGILIIPGKICDSRNVEEQDEFIVAEDTTNEEQAAEYDRINAAFDAGEYEDYEPETDELEAEYYEDEFGTYHTKYRSANSAALDYINMKTESFGAPFTFYD